MQQITSKIVRKTKKQLNESQQSENKLIVLKPIKIEAKETHKIKWSMTVIVNDLVNQVISQQVIKISSIKTYKKKKNGSGYLADKVH